MSERRKERSRQPPYTQESRSKSQFPDTAGRTTMPSTAAFALIGLLLLASLQAQPLRARAQIFSAPATAPASMPPAPALDCTGALLHLSSCLTYVAAGSNLTRPDKGCCGALAGVVEGEAACLCELVAGYGAYGVRVDVIRALALPTICRVDAPPPALCAVLGVPVGSIAAPPGGAVPAESGYGTPATTPATAAANVGPATRHSPTHLHFRALPHCLALFMLLL